MEKFAKWILAYALGSIAMAALIGCHHNTELSAMRQMPTMADPIRDRVAWPCGLAVTKDTKVMISINGVPSGFVVLNAGVILYATGLTDDGLVTAEMAGQTITVPMEDTSIIDFLDVPESLRKMWEQGIEKKAPAKQSDDSGGSPAKFA